MEKQKTKNKSNIKHPSIYLFILISLNVNILLISQECTRIKCKGGSCLIHIEPIKSLLYFVEMAHIDAEKVSNLVSYCVIYLCKTLHLNELVSLVATTLHHLLSNSMMFLTG